jgi:hypothetical protein
MIAVRVMQPPIHEIVDVVTVGNWLMTVARSMGVACAADVWRALHWIVCADSEHMFVNMIVVHVVQMPVMQIIYMPLVANRDVSTVWAVPMAVISVMRQVTRGHDVLLLMRMPFVTGARWRG